MKKFYIFFLIFVAILAAGCVGIINYPTSSEIDLEIIWEKSCPEDYPFITLQGLYDCWLLPIFLSEETSTLTLVKEIKDGREFFSIKIPYKQIGELREGCFCPNDFELWLRPEDHADGKGKTIFFRGEDESKIVNLEKEKILLLQNVDLYYY